MGSYAGRRIIALISRSTSVEDMERAPSNSTENDSDEQPRVNRCKRKRTTRYRRKSTPSNQNNKRAAGTHGDLLEAPPRAIGVDGVSNIDCPFVLNK